MSRFSYSVERDLGRHMHTLATSQLAVSLYPDVAVIISVDTIFGRC